MPDRSRTRDLSEVPDPDLLARIAQGELGALGVLYDRYERDVRRVVARLASSSADIDDVVQNTFLEVLRAAAGYDGRPNARPWLIGLGVTQIRRDRRSVSRLAARLAAWAREPASPPTSPEESAVTSARAARLRRAFEALSTKKREVVVLVTLEGLSGEEVARVLDVPVATVWTRLHHARKELSHAMSQEES